MSRLLAQGLRPRSFATCCALVVLLAALTATAPAWAGVVVLLKSRACPAFDAAAGGFRAAHAGPVLELTLGDGPAAPIISRILAARPDAIVAIGSRAARLVSDRVPQIPLVFCGLPQAEALRLREREATGVTIDIPPALQLQGLRSVAPDVHRVAMFYSPTTGVELLRQARLAAPDLGITLIEVPVPALDQLAPRARKAIVEADAMWLPDDPEVAAPEAFRFLLDLSLRTHKPLFTFSDQLVRAGALAAVIPDFAAAGAQAAEAMARLDGGDTADAIPQVPVRRTHLVINRATAEVLDHRLPAPLPLAAEVVP